VTSPCPTVPRLPLPKLSEDEGDAPNKAGVVSVLTEESVESEDFDGPPGNKVPNRDAVGCPLQSNLCAEAGCTKERVDVQNHSEPPCFLFPASVVDTLKTRRA